MKKIIMIVGLTILTSCGNKSSEKKDENNVLDSMFSSNDAPKCDDPQVIETVFSILKENEQIINGNVDLPINDYKNPEITNIITTAKDDELKSCNCEGTASVVIEGMELVGGERSADYKPQSNVSYFAQKNDKGEIIVQVNSVDTFR